MKEDFVLAGIVMYNPEEKRLYENIKELAKQVDDIILVDNASENIKRVLFKMPDEVKARINCIQNKENQGIAMALKQIMDYAKKNNYEWVLTLDQDSIIEHGLIEKYCEVACLEEYQDVGMFTCLIKDRNFKDLKYEKQDRAVIEVPYCITSAAFTNVKKYFETKGYDINFFIDCVDFDICYSLREQGYRICRIDYIGLYHEVGHGENRRFFGKQIVVYHQLPFRIYYLSRNTIWLNIKHKRMFPMLKMYKKMIALFLRIILYEDCKKEKWREFRCGIKNSRKYVR